MVSTESEFIEPDPAQSSDFAAELEIEPVADADPTERRILNPDGNMESFEEIYARTYVYIFRHVNSKVVDSALAEDLTQETYLRAWRALNAYREQGKDIAAWLCTIANNLVTDHYKNQYTKRVSPDEDIENRPEAELPHHDVERQVLGAAALDQTLQVLGTMDENQRDAIHGRHILGMSIIEYAQLQGITEGAVKQIEVRARRKLLRQLQIGKISDLIEL